MSFFVVCADLCEGGNLMSSIVNRSDYCERDVALIIRQLVEAVQVRPGRLQVR